MLKYNYGDDADTTAAVTKLKASHWFVINDIGPVIFQNIFQNTLQLGIIRNYDFL